MFNTTTCALVADKLKKCEQHVPMWFQDNTLTSVLCVLAIFLTGIVIGCACALRMRPLTRVLLLLVIYASGMLISYAAGLANGHAHSE